MENLLKKYLKTSGISRLKFAIKIGVDPSVVYRWINYESLPSPTNAQRIERVTKGKIPLSYWGYVKTVKGKLIRLARKPLGVENIIELIKCEKPNGSNL